MACFTFATILFSLSFFVQASTDKPCPVGESCLWEDGDVDNSLNLLQVDLSMAERSSHRVEAKEEAESGGYFCMDPQDNFKTISGESCCPTEHSADDQTAAEAKCGTYSRWKKIYSSCDKVKKNGKKYWCCGKKNDTNDCPTCASYTCATSGWVKKDGVDSDLNPSESQCCEATCASYTCATSGWVKKDGVDSLTDPSDSQCCEATCAAYTCQTTDWEKKDGVDSLTDVSDSQCCEGTRCETWCTKSGTGKLWTDTNETVNQNTPKCSWAACTGCDECKEAVPEEDCFSWCTKDDDLYNGHKCDKWIGCDTCDVCQ